MSTTVSYKGETLVTLNDETKKLDTKGTWLEDDITITDTVSGNAVTIVDTPDSAGGIIREITTVNETTLQAGRTIDVRDLNEPQVTISPETGYDGFQSLVLDTREDLTNPKDVDFIDYDGRLVYSYTAQEFLALEEMPANPSNPGLIAQGWNWTLTDAQEYVAEWGALVIGQSYITDNGRTRVYIDWPQSLVDISEPVAIKLYSVVSGTGTVYWGDGSTSNITTGTGNKSVSHTYSIAGQYIIEINIASGSFAIGYRGANQSAFGSPSSSTTGQRADYCVKKVEIGSGITQFARQPFRACNNMKSITIPITLTGMNEATATSDGGVITSYNMRGIVFPSGFQGKSTGGNIINSLTNLRYVSLPKSTTLFTISGTTGTSLRKFIMYSNDCGGTIVIKLGYCRHLTHFIMPGNYTTLIDSTCQGSLMKKFTIPATVTTLQTDALIYNYCLTELHVLPKIVPTLSNVRALNGLSPNAVIYVPYSEDHSILEAYKTATNWSNFASYMQEEPQS